MPPVRVAHVIYGLSHGGAERQLLSFLGSLDRHRFESVLVCVDGLGELADEVRILGIEPLVLGRSHRRDVAGLSRLVRLIRQERIKIVHGWLSLPSVFARIAGTLARVPVRIAFEGSVVPTMDSRRARRDAVVERMLAPMTDAYVVNSQAVAASLRTRGVRASKIVVIPNGVAAPVPFVERERARVRAALGSPDEGELVGMTARLDPDFKDHETFLRSVAALVGQGRSLRAVVIGDGPARGSLERLAGELEIADRVAFTGFRPDAARLIGALDVSVLLSYSEGFSNVVLETMAAGVPLLTTDIPPNREAVENGIHGLLVPVRDVGATTAALGRLLDDETLAAGLAAAARARAVEDFSLAVQADGTMALYERLLEKRGR
jgi:glycosyltransferase involved in cell wall biosynthesis